MGIHPALLDAALHGWLLSALVDNSAKFDSSTMEGFEIQLPFAWRGVTLHALQPSWIRVRIVPSTTGHVAVHIADAAGNPVLSVDALATRLISIKKPTVTSYQSDVRPRQRAIKPFAIPRPHHLLANLSDG
jgi:polyketide synthase 12